jgi:hypothetical protein
MGARGRLESFIYQNLCLLAPDGVLISGDHILLF